jgi:hypothetical protein
LEEQPAQEDEDEAEFSELFLFPPCFENTEGSLCRFEPPQAGQVICCFADRLNSNFSN